MILKRILKIKYLKNFNHLLGQNEIGTCFLMSGLANRQDAFFYERRHSVCGIFQSKTVDDTMSWYQSGGFTWSLNCDFESQNQLIKTINTGMTECGHQCLNGSNQLCTHFVHFSSGICKLLTGLARKGNAKQSGNGICAIIDL